MTATFRANPEPRRKRDVLQQDAQPFDLGCGGTVSVPIQKGGALNLLLDTHESDEW